MENLTFKSNESDKEFENKQGILSICYDNLEHVRGNLFIASLDGKDGLININNEILVDFQENKFKKVGSLVFITDGYYYKHLDLDTLQQRELFCSEILDCGAASILRIAGGNYGILGSNGSFIMPPIYTNMKINRIKHDGIVVWVKYKDHEFITEVSPEGLSVTKLDDYETFDSRVRLLATKFKKQRREHYLDSEYKLIYEIANNYDIVTHEEFDDIMFQKAYVPFGLIHTWKNGYAGMAKTNGEIVVPNNRFKEVDGLGYNGIFIVSEPRERRKLHYGVYKEDKGLTVDCVFGHKTTLAGVPITYFMKEVDGTADWWMLGNDGYVHKEITQAFPISKINGFDAYNINVYGHDYTVDKQLKPLNGVNVHRV